MRRNVASMILGLGLAASAFAAKDVTLRFSVWDGDEALRTVRQLCRDFEKENPGIKIKLENYPDYNVYHQKIFITYAAGAAPDVVMMNPDRFQRLAVRGALVNLNELAEKTPGFDFGEYYKEILDAHSYKGKCYVLPRDIAPIGLIYYNKRMFKEAGIPYPDGSWTWDWKIRPELKEKDFLWICEQFKKKDKNGKYVQWGYTPDWPAILGEQTAYQTGAMVLDNFEEPTKVQAGTPEYIKAYQWAADFSLKHHYAPTNVETTSQLMAVGEQLFAQQKVAMYQTGIWKVPNVRRSLKPGKEGFFEWDITTAPAYWNNGKPVRKYTTGGSGYGIMSSAKDKEAAWKFVRYMAGDPGMIAMAKAGIAQPAIRRLAIQKGVWIPGPDSPIEQQYPANMMATDDAVPHVIFAPTSQYAQQVVDRVNRGIELLWNGDTTAQKQFTENQKLAQDRLEVLKKQDALPLFDWRGGAVVGVLLAGTLFGWVFWNSGLRRLTPMSRAEAVSGYKFVSPWLIGFVIFTLGPMILSLLMSFTDWDVIQPAKWRAGGNYQEAVGQDPVFWKSLGVSFWYTLFAVPLGVLGSMGLALLLNQKVKGVALFRTLYYIPSISSAVAGALIWQRLLNPDSGLLNFMLYGPDGNWWLGHKLSELFMTDPSKPVNWLTNEKTALPALIIMSLWGIGGGTVVFIAGLQGIPTYLYEAATLDGASIWQRFRTVTLPLLTPTIFFTMITGIVGAFQAFHQAFIMTQGGPNDATRFYVYHLYTNAFEAARMGYASALGWILFFIILIFTIVQFKASKWVYYEADVK